MTEKDELIAAYKSFRHNRMYVHAIQCAEEVYKRDRADGMFLIHDFREAMIYEMQTGGESSCLDLSRRSYIFTAPDCFDDFMVAMEWNRNPNARFWLPRRRILEGNFGMATAIDNFIIEKNGKKLTLSMPPGAGKSTMIKFLMAYIMGKYPDSKNMYVSYADSMVKMMMDAVLDMTSGDEYNFSEIFPGLGKPDKSAEYNTIGYRRRGDAQTFNLCSIGGSITGRTRADLFMITDDLVKNAEEARSPERLETLYANYTDTISTRQIGDKVKEIMLGTIWSIYDPISREKIRYEGEPGYHFYAFPVCDEEGHSNFHYDCDDCYTDERIAQIKEKLDPVTFSCLYLQRGIQKEGMPFTEDNMKWYDGILPSGEPDKIIAFCDVAYGGGDSLSMPMLWKYGEDGFIHDVVFNRKDKSVTEPIVANRLAKNKVQKVRFEANVGGDAYADDISKKLKEIGYSCNVTSKRAPNTISKMVKIEQYQQDIRNLYFRRDKGRGREYDMFIKELTTFSFTQKNLHDDAADSLAGLCGMENSVVTIQVSGRREF